VRAAWSVSLTILVACVLLVQYEQYRVLEGMAVAMVDPSQEPNELVTTWISGGQHKSHTTTRQEGETKEHWERRHLDEVAAKWQQFPPDG